jgi:hypothetical protein
MLAYLDDVLDPNDAHELEQKIEESSFASGLVHRVRDSMRRLRLGTPDLDGQGVGVDANSVAEYLDSTLDPEDVPEFEKACLDHDVHLAEVASCHQILTLVLGEPADVDPSLREQVYRIGQPDAPPVVSAPSGNGFSAIDEEEMYKDAAAPSAPAADTTDALAPISPDYMQRRSQIPVKSLAITLLLGFLIALAALQVLGVGNLRGMLGLRSEEVVSDRTAPVQPQPETANSSETVLAPEIPSTQQVPAPEERPTLDPSNGSDPATTPTPNREAETDSPPAAIVERPTLPDAAAETGTTAEPTVIPEASGSPAVTESPVSEPPRAAIAAEEVSPPVPLGTFISEEQVLARFNAEDGAWFRLAPHAPLLSGDVFVSLPTYRPQLLLSPGVKITLCGESHVELGTPETTGPSLAMTFGRAIVVPVGDPSVSLQLDLGGRKGTVLFADADSVLAIEMKRFWAPGSKAETAVIVVELFTLSGEIGWREGESDPTAIQAGRVLTFIGEEPANLFEAAEMPGWVDGRDLSDIDRRSSTELRHYLAADRPLSLSLMERTDFRKVEVRVLAARSLCCLDIFEPSIEALNDESHHSFWFRHFDALRQGAARSPESSVKLHRALEKLTGEDAGEMFRLLAGYSPDQLAAAGAKDLVDSLEHERMSVRVLGHENLKRITGRTQNFRPEQPPSQEKTKVAKWRRNLADGRIVYEKPPGPLPERAPVAASEDAAIPSE